ncbi:uncharacterized protein [Primulina eburnea]|uniref:uncharacterized protein n=1 Tax=Primulina eburnea TaxID=1245227 RepID=UPI003C6C6E35
MTAQARSEMAEREKMTEYERRRLENMKRNGEMLAALKIHSRVNELSAAAKRQRAQCKSYKSSPTKKPKIETPVVLRRSLRKRGVPPDASTAGGLKYDNDDDNQTKKIPKLKTTATSTNSLYKPVPLAMRDACTSNKSSDMTLVSTILRCSEKSLYRESDEFPGDSIETLRRSKPFEQLKGRKRVYSSVRVDALKLEQENIARVVTGKILNFRFFPTLDMQMVVVGNKYGDIGFWNVEAKEEDGGGIYVYHPHSGPISGIVIDPFSISKLYSSCYDGFVRLLDVEKEVFDMVYASEYTIYSMALNPHNNKSLYFSEGRGGIKIWDLRAAKSVSSCDLHEDRINTIDFNLENSNLMATSSTDGTACIWDLRLLSADEPKPLQTIKHKRAIQSAYFSPTGKCLATTSMDNTVGLFSGPNYKDTSMVFHYNQTGRWISTFRGIWGWDDSYVFIGNMRRGIDVISVASEKIVTTLESELVSAISCRFDAHPCNVGMLAGATSGGQVYIWTPS